MDDYEYDRLANEYLRFPPAIDEGDYPATIDPALLQSSDTALDFLIEQQQQQQPETDDPGWLVRPSEGNFGPDLGPPAHGFFSASLPDTEEHGVVSQNPSKCACGSNFTKHSSLERHIRDHDKQLVPGYPCHECPAYQGKNGFRRKDHFVQHLKFFHKYSDDQLSAGISSRRTRRLNISVCRFPECDYYRGPEFRDLGIDQQNENRPFDKQSDYTHHMKREHNWSPYPCKVSGCSKVGGNGFFTTGTLEKHYKEKHPKSKIPATTPPDRVKDTARCEYCRRGMNPGSIVSHQQRHCRAEVSCRLCHQLVSVAHRDSHLRNSCEVKVECSRCRELVERRRMVHHESEVCKGEVVCRFCFERMESQQLEKHYDECKGEAKCRQCSANVERRLLKWGICTKCRKRWG